MTVDPFLEGVVDQTTPFFVDESAVMLLYDTSWSSLNFDNRLIIFDKISWVIFAIVLLYLITTIVLLHQNFLVENESIIQRFSSVTFQIIGTLLQMGKFTSRNVFCDLVTGN